MPTPSGAPLVYLIAGEASGDRLGARLMESLKTQMNGNVRFAGIGGEKMQEQGMKSFLPIEELSVMGFAEIIPHIPKFLGFINRTVQDILQQKPDIVITIDSPGFCFRVVKKLRKLATPSTLPKLVHYVAPTVWAYKPKRARNIAKIYDHLLVLLPFEPPYFEKEGLATTFVGHPVTWEWQTAGSAEGFRREHNIDPHSQVLLLLPGSRKGEIARHMPVFNDTVEILAERFPRLVLVTPVAKHLGPQVQKISQHWKLRHIIVHGDEAKLNAFAAATAALAKSGTVTLELAMAKVPMVVTYMLSPISVWLLKRMIQIDTVTLINIVQQKKLIPELLQEGCQSEALADALTDLLKDNGVRQKQVEETRPALVQLGLGAPVSPSNKAAQTIIDLLQGRTPVKPTAEIVPLKAAQ